MEAAEHRLRELEGMVKRHDRDLYVGNGKPSITTRVAIMEECVSGIRKNLRQITWLLMSTFATALATIIVTLVMRGH